MSEKKKAPIPSQLIPDGENLPETTSSNLPAELTNKWKRAVTETEKDFINLSNPDRARTESAYIFLAFQSNPDLQRCTEDSIRNAIVNLATTNFTLNPHLKLCALVARKNKEGVLECFFEITYVGMIKLLKDYSIVTYIEAFTVFSDEEFSYDLANNIIKHTPKFAKTIEEQKSREIVGCYSRAEMKNGNIVYHYVPIWEIEKIRGSADDPNSQHSAWTNFYDDMVKKTVIRRHFKLLISGVIPQEIQNAIRLDDEANPHTFGKSKRKAGFSDLFG